jgi:hypothetical protein
MGTWMIWLLDPPDIAGDTFNWACAAVLTKSRVAIAIACCRIRILI